MKRSFIRCSRVQILAEIQSLYHLKIYSHSSDILLPSFMDNFDNVFNYVKNNNFRQCDSAIIQDEP